MRNPKAIECRLRYLFMVTMMLLALPFPAVASAFPDFSFRTVTAFDGLSSNIVNTIYKDKRGFVWLGTQTGLDRFDGISVANFPALAGQTVLALAETDSVNLMVGTDKGLFRFNRKREAVESIPLSGQVLRVNGLKFDASRNSLFAATDCGLFILREGNLRRVLFGNNAFSSDNQLTGIAKGDEEAVFWLTSQESLIKYDADSGKSDIYRSCPSGNGTDVSQFSCLAPAGNRIFLGTRNEGIFCFDKEKKAFVRLENMPCGDVKQLKVEGKDTLYVGSNGDGIQVFKLSTGKKIASLLHTSHEDGICSSAVYTFLKEGNLFFVGTYMGGFCYTPVRDNLFSVYSQENLFRSCGLNVRAFYVDEERKVKIIGTRDGLYYVSEKENRLLRYTQKNSILRSDIILFVSPFGDDYLVGTYRGGLYVLSSDSGELTFFGEDIRFRQESFSTVATERDGKVWIGSSAGIYECDVRTRKYKLYNNQNSSLTNNSIYSVLADSEGRIWIGAGGALFMFDRRKGTFETDLFPEKILPFTKSVRYIYEDKERNLWFCDDKEGVVKADARFTHFAHYTSDDFLPNNSVMSIVESADGKGLWFATQSGLLYRDKKDESGKCFSLYDGMPGYVFNYAVQVLSDGSVWWGNERGLVSYRSPAGTERTDSRIVCPPTITALFVAGKQQKAGSTLTPYSAPFTEEITLSRSENNIALTFSALNYAERNAMLYEYRLEGYDKKWKTLSRGNQVAYTELHMGSYVLKLRSSSAPEAVCTLKITVSPDYVFILRIAGVLLLCLLVFMLFYKGNFRKLLPRTAVSESASSSGSNKAPDMPKEKYQKSRIDVSTGSDIEKKLRSCMESDRLYLNPDLKLQDVASAIGFNASDVSQTLNVFMHTNFTDFVNQYRVEMFISRMKKEGASKYTLASLSEECGFSSRTSFFRSFRKLKGMSPSEYIKQL